MKKGVVFAAVGIIVLILTGSTTSDSYWRKLKTREPDSSRMISLVFAGDVMAHDVNYNRRPYSNIYKDIRDLLWQADLSFANLEFVFDPSEPASGYPNFNAPLGYVRAAIKGGFNVFSLANNHSLDLEQASVTATLAAITEISTDHKISYNGINSTVDSYLKSTFFEVQELRIGFLAVTSFLNRLKREKLVNLVPYYDEEAQALLISRIREDSANADMFIVSYHGGKEYRRSPSADTKALFGRMIDAGADIVWGHHPHVTQPWQTMHTRGGDKLVFYSTGNLISGQTWNVSPDDGAGRRAGTGEAALYVVKAKVGAGKSSISHVSAIPIYNHQHPDHGMVVKRFDGLPGMEFSRDWEVYYTNRLLDLSTYLRDISTWGFEK